MAGVIKFFTDNPIARLIAYIILALLGWEVVKRHLKEAGREAERKAIAIKQAEEQARLDKARLQQAEDNQNAAQRANETVAGVAWVRSRDELRLKSPADAAILLDPTEQGRS